MVRKKKQIFEEIETRQKITLIDIEEVVKNFEQDFSKKKTKPRKIINEILSIYRDHVAKLPDNHADLNVAKNRPTILRRNLIRKCLGIEEPDSGMKKEFSGFKKEINQTLRGLIFKNEKNKSLNPLGLILKKAEQSRTANEGETSNYFVSIAIPEKSPPEVEKKKPSEARSKKKLAPELRRGGKHSEAIQTMREALGIARDEGNEEEEVEILLGLALFSSGPSERGDQQYYFQEAEKKFDKLKSSAVKAIYFRARAAVLKKKRDLIGAEEAYKAALNCCLNEPEDEKNDLAIQGCVVRSSYVHLLCNLKRLEEARPLLAECEEYARQNKDAEEGELFQAALEAGIHFSLEAGYEDGMIQRIAELEQFASTFRLANRIGDVLINVANQASHRKAHRAALAAAETSIRLGRRCDDGLSPSFLVGALYTEAMVIMQAGDDEKALCKAKAILYICNRPEDEIVKQLTHELIADIRRRSGDSQTAVDLARMALSIAKGRPEDIAFTKSALARALNDNGQTEEALEQAKEAWILTRPSEVPAIGKVDFLSQITNYASQLGFEKDVAEALGELEQIPDEDEEVKANKTITIARASANRDLRQRFIDILRESEPGKTAGTVQCASLQEANKLVVRPLLRLWKEMPEAVTESYDFWGRGNFERILLNTRSFQKSFNVTIEVRSLEDVKKAIRLWGIYTDFLILLWKGITNNVVARVPFPEDYEDPGGWGYMVAAGTVFKKKGSKKKWYLAMSQTSLLPGEVMSFLATEALPFIQSGRLLVVPAVGAACVNPGYGTFEQLLAEAENAIPSIRWKGFEGTPIGFIPYSPNASFEFLAELAEVESARLRKLRALLYERSKELKPGGEILEARMLSSEIYDAFRDMEDINIAFARKKGLERAKEPLTGTTAHFKSNGEKLANVESDSPYAPLFILQSLGYGWQVDSPQVLKPPSRFEPQGRDVIGAWLAPPSAGWAIPYIEQVEQNDET